MTQTPMTFATCDVREIEQQLEALPFSIADLRLAIAGLRGVQRVTVNKVEDNLLVNVVGGDACVITKMLAKRPADLKLSLVYTDL